MAEYREYAESLKLTAEQRDIMDMIFVEGCDYRYIADKLGYGERTIKAKVRRLLDII